MPTGYTADVADGKITDFPTFAMKCARAMGACIMMRDDPSDAPIPDEFLPSQYNNQRLEETLAEIAELEGANDEVVAQKAAADFQERHNLWSSMWRKRDEKRARYQSMLALVNEWDAPSPEHVGFKDFMINQLRESISFDCSHEYYDEPVARGPAMWKQQRLESLHKSAAYNKQHQAEENERTDNRNQWIRQLRESLKGEHAILGGSISPASALDELGAAVKEQTCGGGGA